MNSRNESNQASKLASARSMQHKARLKYDESTLAIVSAKKFGRWSVFGVLAAAVTAVALVVTGLFIPIAIIAVGAVALFSLGTLISSFRSITKAEETRSQASYMFNETEKYIQENQPVRNSKHGTKIPFVPTVLSSINEHPSEPESSVSPEVQEENKSKWRNFFNSNNNVALPPAASTNISTPSSMSPSRTNS